MHLLWQLWMRQDKSMRAFQGAIESLTRLMNEFGSFLAPTSRGKASSGQCRLTPSRFLMMGELQVLQYHPSPPHRNLPQVKIHGGGSGSVAAQQGIGADERRQAGARGSTPKTFDGQSSSEYDP